MAKLPKLHRHKINRQISTTPWYRHVRLLLALVGLIAMLGNQYAWLKMRGWEWQSFRTFRHVPLVLHQQQTHCPALKTEHLPTLGNVLLVDVSEEHALSTAKACYPDNRQVTILVMVQQGSTSKERGNDDPHLDNGRIRIYSVQVTDEGPVDLLAFHEEVELPPHIPITTRFSSVWIRSPCEVVHSHGIDKTPEFAIKLQEFLLSWKLMLVGQDDGPDTTHWFIEECENEAYTTTLLHNSVMFRPSELVSRQGMGLFQLDVQRSALRERYELLFRNHGNLGLNNLNATLQETPRPPAAPSCLQQTCRYAYMTLLHHDDKYVCGALVMGHSIRMFDKKHDLVALVSPDMPQQARAQLTQGGWNVVELEPVPDPKGVPTYFRGNFNKLRAWKVGYERGYDKVTLVDSDILFVQDPSVLFHALTSFAGCSQTATQFNAGLIVFEPSEWLHDYMIEMIPNLGVPYDFAEQSFLNQVFGWRMNLLDKSTMLVKKNVKGPYTKATFAIHYVGVKPWLCPSRDHDCNSSPAHWLVHKARSNDDLFRHWFKVHDEMEHRCFVS